ncbi:tRNA (adenosine(37)-N6)-threonylcarbamoyltransferase complex dimerization subunit type 1 TsaB [Bacillus sp. CGMCC 1.16541]|uniref:tRNA (adenosine(37)-N6)-threonylcarbamoyltransferase complex dimerization subunit type 1 TsaB n=1 Tax=Bacillus sp. CGMCC 1.16541 TaxID=2185143 RepID=UPI000D73BDC4|nr:tRNA (adenosine(37)-N6)-threonylcarbamoyltransferase complex dimerization subunit type 1 TsaB [Bacillus sp. CGMCC 1.16541]
MKTLAIDTSNLVMGIAVVDDSQVIGEVITNLKKNHSVRLMPAIETLLKECSVNAKDLERIVVAQGPGSYTGVRIGVTIAKTLAWTLNIPLIGVSSLEVLAANGRYFEGFVCPLFDARRQQIFTGLYQYQADGTFVKKVEDQLVINVDWLQKIKQYNQKVLFLGNDVKVHEEIIKRELGDLAVIAPYTQHNPRPSQLALIGMQKEATPLHAFVPNYARLAEAEANWLASQNQNS